MGGWLMFGAATDDEDTLFRYYDRVTNEIMLNIAPFAIIGEISDITPVTARQLARTLDALSLMTWSGMMHVIGEEDALTSEGVLRG